MTRRNVLTPGPTSCGLRGPLFTIYARFYAAINKQADKKKCLHFSWQAFRDLAAEPKRDRLFGIIEDLVRWENTALGPMIWFAI